MTKGNVKKKNAHVAGKAKAIRNEYEREVELTRILAAADVQKTLWDAGFKTFGYSVIAICCALSVYFVAGKTTKTDINVGAVVDTGGSDSYLIGIAIVAVIIGIFGVVYGNLQKKLRLIEVNKMSPEKIAREELVDPRRTSSGLKIPEKGLED